MIGSKPYVKHYKVLSSTQDELISLMQSTPSHPFYAIQAEEQIKGRGQFQRKWLSLKGNFLASFGLFFSKLPLHFPFLSLCLAAHLCGYFRSQNIFLSLHWPNDLMLKGAKVGGLLVESKSFEKQQLIAIGIGINLLKAPKLPIPTHALHPFFPHTPTAEDIFFSLLSSLPHAINTFYKEGFTAFYNDFSQHFLADEKLYTFFLNGSRLKGKIVKITKEGRFCMQDSSGVIHTLRQAPQSIRVT